MRTLALDQSSHITGWAIFEDKTLIEFGKFNFQNPDLGERLHKIRCKVQQLVEENQIERMILEDVQFQEKVVNNVQTFKILAETLGVLYEYGITAGLEPQIVLAGTWKSFLGIKGHNRTEQKRNAQAYIVDNYQIKPTQDECDAICIGLYATHKKASAF